jgi:hypothetical protein
MNKKILIKCALVVSVVLSGSILAYSSDQRSSDIQSGVLDLFQVNFRYNPLYQESLINQYFRSVQQRFYDQDPGAGLDYRLVKLPVDSRPLVSCKA